MQIELNGKTYQVEDYKVTGKWVDNGIGAYEFWGARGNDVRMEVEKESVEILEAYEETDTDGDFPKVTDPETLKALEQYMMESDEVEATADDCPEPDYDEPEEDDRCYEPNEPWE